SNPIYFKAALNWPIDTFSPNCPAIEGATAAITFLFSFNISKIGRNSILSIKFLFLQESTHIPQFTHKSILILGSNVSLSTIIASKGQAFSQIILSSTFTQFFVQGDVFITTLLVF